MNTLTDQLHTISDLFAQLGLPHTDAEIDHFIKTHAPLPAHLELWDAPWWNPAQAQLLHELMTADAEGALVVDALNTRLRNQQT